MKIGQVISINQFLNTQNNGCSDIKTDTKKFNCYQNKTLSFQSLSAIKPYSVMTPQQRLIETCKTKSFENYNASAENIKTGVFQLDLHSHSNHSDGYGDVRHILDEISAYSEELYKKTGKPFTFALTDHDSISGVREANKYIAQNKDKFKHVNFVPGVELSFVFNDNGEVKAGEILAYFIDPDSKEMQELVGNVRENRDKMIDACIEKLGEGFSRSDMEDYFINRKDDNNETFAYNLHYRVRNYAQIKNRVNQMAKEFGVDADSLYKKMIRDYVYEGDECVVPKPFVSPEGFDEYLSEHSVKTNTKPIDENINKICEEFFPKIQDGEVIANSENSLEHIIETLKDNKSVMLGFAHPFFTAIQMQDFRKGFDRLVEIGKGRFIFTENYHQAYSSELLSNPVTKQKISDINDYLTAKGLIAIGGRDNHSSGFFD